MGRNEHFLQIAQSLEPKLFRETVFCRKNLPATLKAGDTITLDFGNHYVGYLTLDFSTVGGHFDAPAWLRIKFAERLCELEENAEAYHGWVSRVGFSRSKYISIYSPARCVSRGDMPSVMYELKFWTSAANTVLCWTAHPARP